MLDIVFSYWSATKEIQHWNARFLNMYSMVFDLYTLYSKDGVINWGQLNKGYKIVRPHYLGQREQHCEQLRDMHFELWQRHHYKIYKTKK